MKPEKTSFQDFDERGILIVRNPYEAILSTHNFLYGGHHGKAPKDNYKRKGKFSYSNKVVYIPTIFKSFLRRCMIYIFNKLYMSFQIGSNLSQFKQVNG